MNWQQFMRSFTFPPIAATIFEFEGIASMDV